MLQDLSVGVDVEEEAGEERGGEELETGPYDHTTDMSGDENDIDEETMSGDNDVENSIHWTEEVEAGASAAAAAAVTAAAVGAGRGAEEARR